jgi:hypothetical protein
MPIERIFVIFIVSEQRAIILLYSINKSILITETKCVYCALRIESLNIIQNNVSL